MSQADSTPDDGFDFIRKMWANVGFGLPGAITPTLDVAELERRIKDLQAVEGWLKMNLGMLQMTIQGLEVQRATLAAMQAMNRSATSGEAAAAFTNPAQWGWPFSAPGTPGATPDADPAPDPAAHSRKT
ncbi:MAG: hypothetical protein REI09_09470 [Candidatus Dactylopiibacterium sp.]|nr:hypothetical protein [Candidatus Dactylopiibacterium sp.]